MQSQPTDSNSQVRRDRVLVSRSLGNYWWATALTIGSIGFLVVGFSSFIGFNILPFVHAESIQFLPQGLVISFYGALGLSTAAYLWLAMLWKVGDGYNEFNKIKGTLRLFRWGFPGTQRRIDLSFPIQDIEGILIRQQTGIGEQRILCARLGGRREIPLLGLNTLESQTKIEGWGAELAACLNVPLITP